MTDKVKWRDAKHLHEKIAKLTEARARDAETIRELVAALMAVEKETNSRRQGEIATTALITFAAQEKNDD